MGTTYGTQIPRDGLSLLLDPYKVKTQDGTTWKDLSGNGNDALLTGSPVFANGSVTFDGTNYATIAANQDSLDFRTAQTVIIWMRYTDVLDTRRNPYDQAYGGYGTWTHETVTSINWYHGTNGGNSTSYTSRASALVPSGEWKMMAVTRDTTYLRWYMNDVKTLENGAIYGVLPVVTTLPIRLGRGYAGYWEGEMGLIALYNKALTEQEMKDFFNNTRKRFNV